MAQQFFQLVPAERVRCSRAPMHGVLLLFTRQFEDVNIYLNSIKVPYNDDDFNWNYGISLASTGNFKELGDFITVQSDKYRRSCYCWLSRCYIMNKKARLAWELYLKMDNTVNRLTCCS